MTRYFTCLCVLFAFSQSQSQVYDDYIGAGHSEGILITTSDEFQAFGWDQIATGEASLSGSGLDARHMETTRFLSQATLGFDPSVLDEVMDMDFEAWIDSQVDEPYVDQYDLMFEIIDQALAIWVAEGNDAEDYFYPGFQHLQYAWWQTNMTNTDLLRQRVALAYSEIFVVSILGTLEDHVQGVAEYHDMLIGHAFGNYRDLIEDVTYSPAMGIYLSHYNNPLNIDSLNVHPDENYAREIMQLFSIGLYELNVDGSFVLDVSGNPIATYDNDDIKEFAKIFTGVGPGEVIPNDFGLNDPYFGMNRYLCDFTVPMQVFEDWHEVGPKNLLNGYVIPSGQTGVQDISSTLDHLFNHQNVGPFLARRLIQQFVKSNPTPAYIERVALKFNDNGQGERGDMLAVIKAVLLDEEARTCDWIQDSEQGKLLSPFQRYAYFARHIDKLGPENTYWNVGYDYFQSTEQIPFTARSVFNYYLPDYQPQGEIADADLYAPEFEIHNSRTSIGYLNNVLLWTNWWAMLYAWDTMDPVFVDIGAYEDLARDPEVLINELDRTYTHGQMTEELRANLRTTMAGMTLGNIGDDYLEYRARTALYLIMISPDYVILK